MAGAVLRFRDLVRRISPWWLSEREQQGKTVAARFLGSLVAPLDVLAEATLQALYASWPGAGTPEALPYIGRSRNVMRGMADTDDEFAEKCRGWLERAEKRGTQLAIAREIRDYVAGHPRVRVINRAGHWVTLNADGTAEATDAPWDWDSVSNPERATDHWSELWVVVYTTTFPISGQWGDGRKWGARDSGIGHQVKHVDRDAILHLVAEAKAARSKIRTIIWTTDDTLFDPTDPWTCPDGTWGQWSLPGSNPRVPGGRIRTTCRYWEPE